MMDLVSQNWHQSYSVDPKRGLILVFLVQHSGFPGDGGKSQAAFRKAAEELFGGSKP
jgi:hypothetical protein